MYSANKDVLIESLVRDGYLKNPSIIDAFEKIDRKDFVREDFKENAYWNQPLPIGQDQTISQPLTVAFMLELLEPKTGEKILDVGAGSGWQAALLAEIVGNPPAGGGKIITIERIPEIKSFAEANLNKYELLEKGTVKLILGDGSKGLPEEAPYDKIISAASATEIPQTWKEQLKIGGRIVTPVEESIVVLDKVDQNHFTRKEYFGFSFVPLVKD